MKGDAESFVGIDAVWRDPGLRGVIILALEHENEGELEAFLGGEIRRLADLISTNKVAITYPSAGEEEDAIDGIRELV